MFWGILIDYTFRTLDTPGPKSASGQLQFMANTKELIEALQMQRSMLMQRGKVTKVFEPVATIPSIFTKFIAFHTVQNLKGGGRKVKVTSVLLRMIVWDTKENSTITSRAIMNNLSNAGTSISRQILQRTLHKAGLHGH